MLFPTALVGSYPQPEWLIDRARLAERFPPRVRARELWRIPETLLAEAQDDATVLAIRAQEAAGLDIITDGEIRRESYSNRFATALEGVDIDNPGMALDRSGHPNPVPRVVGRIRRRHPVEVDDLLFLRRHTDRTVKMTVPGPFTMSQQAQIEHYGGSRELAAMDYAEAVNGEIRDLFAAGADIVQIDEPYMQARPDDARAYGLRALNRALEGVRGTTAVHICFGYAAIIHDRPAGLLVPARARRLQLRTGIDRNRAVETRLRRPVPARGQEDHPRGHRPRGSHGRDAGDGGCAHPPRAAVRRGREHRRRARLRHEVPAARRCVWKDAGDGRGCPHRARTVRILRGTSMRHIESTWLPAAALLALALTATEGQAQPVIIEGEGLEEILVTARKRDEALIDVPVAINASTTRRSRSAGIRRPQDFIALTPNMTMVQTQNQGTSFIVVRGISQARNSEPSVAVLIDGVLMANPSQFNQELFDIERIQVLKGPQGALYGRNAIGGAVIIETREPGDEIEGSVMAGYESGPGYAVRGGVGGPLGGSDTWKFQLSGSYFDTDGHIDNPHLGEEADPFEDLSGRAKLLWEPNDSMSADLRVYMSQVDTQALYFNITEQRRTTRACRCESTIAASTSATWPAPRSSSTSTWAAARSPRSRPTTRSRNC